MRSLHPLYIVLATLLVAAPSFAQETPSQTEPVDAPVVDPSSTSPVEMLEDPTLTTAEPEATDDTAPSAPTPPTDDQDDAPTPLADDQEGASTPTEAAPEPPPEPVVAEEPTAPEIDPAEMELLMQSLAADAGDEMLTSTVAPPPQLNTTIVSDGDLEMAFILDAAAAAFNDVDPMQGGGHDPNHTGFTLQQLELHVESNVDPYFMLTGNIVFSLFGVEVEEIFATTLALPHSLQARAGQFLHRFGRLNATHPHAWNFVDQPVINGKFFGGEGSRGVGAELSWLMPTPWFAELIVSTAEGVGECCGRSFYGGDDVGVRGPDDLLYNVRLSQFFALSGDVGLNLGLSTQQGPNSTGYDNRTQIFGGDVFVRYKPLDSTRRAALSWQTELMYRTRQIPYDLLEDWGGYSQLVWSIDPRWETGLRGEYVTGVDGDPTDPEWTDERHRESAQVTFYPSHFSRLRLQVRRDVRTWESQESWGAMLSIEGVVGAHGAHAY